MSATNQEQTLLDAIEALRVQIAALSERVALLEAATNPARPTGLTGAGMPKSESPAAAAAAEPAKEEISEELLLVLSAAIAAFLGKRPHIRQIRLLHSGAWAQQGRVSIQASHSFVVRHEQ
jgi:methylmalonyl-CoA carboxyltransferase large subunit